MRFVAMALDISIGIATVILAIVSMLEGNWMEVALAWMMLSFCGINLIGLFE